MDLLIAGNRVNLSPAELLGEGGEAMVYHWNEYAVKVYREGNGTSNIAGTTHADEAKILAFPQALPARVIAPRCAAYDARKRHFVGYAMDRVDGAHELRKLSKQSWRKGRYRQQDVTALFQGLHAQLKSLHSRGVVVGDLNDANILFRGQQTFLIDADSMQFDAYPCPVAHELFLDPRLYGVQLSAQPCFTPETDWYAFTVQLFRCLLLVHPYGGVHAAQPTLLRRAEARLSVLQPGVQLPPSSIPWKVLPEALLDFCRAMFDADHRGEFPRDLLDVSWKQCGCGQEYAGNACPLCACQAAVAPRPALRIVGRCEVRTMAETVGVFIDVAVEPTLDYLERTGNQLRRRSGITVDLGPEFQRPDAGFHLQNGHIWARLGRRCVCLSATLPPLYTDLFQGEAVLEAGAGQLFRLEGGWLFNAEGVRYGQVLEGQTWLKTTDALGVGVSFTPGAVLAFVFDPSRPGLRQVTLQRTPGRVVEVAASLDARGVVLEYAVESGGRLTHHLHVLDASARALASLSGAPGSHPALSRVGAKVLQGDRILCATTEGLCLVSVNRLEGRLLEQALFVDTAPFLQSEVALAAGPGGTVYVITSSEILQISLKR